MATAGEWVEGARLRTLPAAVAPVLAGSAITLFRHGFAPVRALLALLVALALQVGVNYANDYSDGIRGTDDERTHGGNGPLRLVGSGVARPGAVKRAAFACFAVAGMFGAALVALSGHWWLLAVGVACVLAAWYYTGGEHPYGYAGLGEVFVFVFFGLVAVSGTVYTQIDRVPAAAWAAACAIGLLACQVLVANNLRDVHTDVDAGKHTLATRLGEQGTRVLFAAMSVATVLLLVLTAALTTWWALASLLCLVFLVPATRRVLGGARGRDLIAVLRTTGFAELLAAAALFVACWIAR